MIRRGAGWRPRCAGYRKLTLWTNDCLHAARALYVAEGFQLVKEEPHLSFGKQLTGQYWTLALSPVRGASQERT